MTEIQFYIETYSTENTLLGTAIIHIITARQIKIRRYEKLIVASTSLISLTPPLTDLANVRYNH